MSKIKKNEYETILALSEDNNTFEDAIKAFLKGMRGTELYTNFLSPLNNEYGEYKNDKLAGKDTMGKLANLTQRFATILQKYAVENNFIDSTLENSQNSYETEYQELCKLNFKHQIDYFEKLVAVDKPLIQFVIRGEKGYGQRWLCNKLLYHYGKQKPIHKVCKLDFSSLGVITMQDFLDNLATNLKVEGYEKQKTIKLQRAKLSNSIIAKIKAQSQIFVLENFYNFLHSDGCVEFYNFIEDLYIGIVTQDEPVKGQCVFLFVENIPNPYQQQDKCIFTSQYDNIRTAKSAFENDTQFKIVDLHEIKQISKECINGWLDDVPEYILQHFPNNETINTLLYNCDNGHPEKVIAKICEKLGKTSDYPNKWLKY